MKNAVRACAHQPPLLPCPMCGGRAEVVRAWEPYFVRCAKCGLRTRDRPFDRNIDREWNHRADRHARALTITELVESVAGMFDDTGVAAVWIEGLELTPREGGETATPSGAGAPPSPKGQAFGERDGGGRLTAALIRVGFRYADLVIDVMNADGEWRELDRETIERYGTGWRIWDKRPGTEREQGTETAESEGNE